MTPDWLGAMRRLVDAPLSTGEAERIIYTDLPALLDLVAALGEALDDAHAIMGSEELAGAETIAWGHGCRYTEAFQTRCQVARAGRTATLAAYLDGPGA